MKPRGYLTGGAPSTLYHTETASWPRRSEGDAAGLAQEHGKDGATSGWGLPPDRTRCLVLMNGPR